MRQYFTSRCESIVASFDSYFRSNCTLNWNSITRNEDDHHHPLVHHIAFDSFGFDWISIGHDRWRARVRCNECRVIELPDRKIIEKRRAGDESRLHSVKHLTHKRTTTSQGQIHCEHNTESKRSIESAKQKKKKKWRETEVLCDKRSHETENKSTVANDQTENLFCDFKILETWSLSLPSFAESFCVCDVELCVHWTRQTTYFDYFFPLLLSAHLIRLIFNVFYHRFYFDFFCVHLK